MRKRLLIAGGSGMIGSALGVEAKSRGWDVIILSRSKGPSSIQWDIEKGTINIEQEASFDAIINLAGASITEKRWSEKRKKEIYDSRILAGKTIEKYLADGRIKTSFYLGISGVGIFGDRGQEIVTEQTPIPPNEDWLIKTTIDWEAAHLSMTHLGIRTVVMRTGIVLSTEGGALKEIMNTPGFAVLSYFGNGKQVWSWIHIHDLVKMILFFIEDHRANGIYIASSPHAVINKELTKAINQHLSPHRLVVGVPKPVMSLILGESHRILFESCNAVPERILREGFQFEFPEISEAIGDLLESS